jgi:hypothetical protein
LAGSLRIGTGQRAVRVRLLEIIFEWHQKKPLWKAIVLVLIDHSVRRKNPVSKKIGSSGLPAAATLTAIYVNRGNPQR